MPVRKLKPIEERDPYAAMVLAAFDEMEASSAGAERLPKADCERCKYMRLPHSGHYCYMFKARPGDACAQFTPVRPNA